jgi:hypothetical protein
MSQIYFDSSDFDKKFGKLVKKTIPDLVKKGMAYAGLELLNDCVLISPTVPIREGWLRGSGSLFVNNMFVAESKFGKSGKATRNHTEPLGKGFVAVVGFNTPYAARMHEGLDFHFREPSAGAKYLETKLSLYREKYIEIVSETIKNGGDTK